MIMKKILLFFVFVLGVFACHAKGSKAKSFYFDGIELQHVKGWTITPSKEGMRTVIHCTTGLFHMTITKTGIAPSEYQDGSALDNKQLERQLIHQGELLTEAFMNSTGKGPIVKEVSEVMDGYISSFPAKYIDLSCTKQVRIRLYAFTAHNSLIFISCTGRGSVAIFEKNFGKILSSFTFIPESGTNRLF